jgi:menaquinone-dependent protoporphyrinogen IX oxidase
MQGIVLYASKYGATEDYARWIAEDLDWAWANIKGYQGDLASYDAVIIGSPIYVGRLRASAFIKKNAALLAAKRFFLFTVGGEIKPADEEKLDALRKRNLPPELSVCPHFHFLGRITPKRFTWFDRTMTRLVAKSIKDPDDKKRLLDGYNDMQRDFIAPLVQAARE